MVVGGWNGADSAGIGRSSIRQGRNGICCDSSGAMVRRRVLRMKLG